jgi:hypothetical protein
MMDGLNRLRKKSLLTADKAVLGLIWAACFTSWEPLLLRFGRADTSEAVFTLFAA